MERSFKALIPYTSRPFFNLRYRILFVLIISTLCTQQHHFLVYQEALAAKYSHTELPTRFAEDLQLWTTDEEKAHFQDRLIANRAE